MLTAKIKRFIEENKLFVKGGRVLVCVSGGPDSVFLLKLINSVRFDYGLTIYVAHVNHCLRRVASDRDEIFVRNVAASLGLPFFSCSALTEKISRDKKISLEDAARRIRYNFFLNLCSVHKIPSMALAHTFDDQAETVFMRLMRGAGVTGLCAMRALSFLEGVKVVRPLLCVSKKEILAHLKKNSIAYRVDASNFKTDFFRNKIRIKVIPYLEKFSPGVKNNLVRLAHSAQEAEDFLQEQVSVKYSRLVRRTSAGAFRIERDGFLRLMPVLRAGILRRVIALLREGLKNVDLKHIRIAMALIEEDSRAERSIDLPDGIRVKTKKDFFIVEKGASKQKRSASRSRCFLLPLRKEIKISSLGYSLLASPVKRGFKLRAHSKFVEYFDLDKLKMPLMVRTRKEGDRIHPLGAGGTQKLKKFFIDNKVVGERKDVIPLVVSGKEIVWVLGMRISEKYKVTDKTARVLKISAKKIKPLVSV